MIKWGKSLLIFTIVFISLTVLPGIVQAQTNVPGDGGITDPDAPIDGGISLLLAAGIGYGVKKARDNKKKQTIHLL